MSHKDKSLNNLLNYEVQNISNAILRHEVHARSIDVLYFFIIQMLLEYLSTLSLTLQMARTSIKLPKCII